MLPPKLSLKLLKWFCKPGYHKDIEGDLLELYERRKKVLGLKKAKWHLFKDILLLFRPGIIRSFKTNQKLNYTDMLWHNFIISFRNFKRYKTSFLINLIGLSTGLASALLIYLWVSDEISINKFHVKDNQLYQVMHNRQLPDDIITTGSTPAPLAKALVEEIPEVEYAVSVNYFTHDFGGEGIISHEDDHLKTKGIFAGKEYFNVFSYDLSQGNKNMVLANKESIVISEGLAKRLFNTTENIIGKTLEWNHRRFEGPFQISGVFKNPPSNSTVQYDVIFSFEKLLEADRYARQWNSGPAKTYLILKKTTNIDQLNAKISRFLKLKNPTNNKSTLFVQQYSKKYLYGQYENGVPVGGRIAYVSLFSIIALFLIVIACINFMNLSTAQASRKMKEIGVKKAIGVSRKQLVIQFLGESIFMAYLSLGIAIALILLFLPQFNHITGKYLDLNIGVIDILIVLGIVLFTGLVSGSYPALKLSGFSPMAVLKGKRNTLSGEQWVRNGLVILQFTISVIFIVGFLVVNEQIEFIQTKNLGYSRDNILCFKREGRHNYDPEGFLSELKNIPGVVSASSIPGSILHNYGRQGGYSWRGLESDREYTFEAPTIGYDVIETLGIEILDGRSFSRDYKDDDQSKIILNESAVKMMGLENPVGKIIKHGPGEQQIIGVVKDFQYGSIHRKMKPLIFRFRNSNIGRNTLVKIKSGTEMVSIKQIENLFKKFHPRYPFEFTFLDDDYQALYDAENRVAVLSKYFTAIAIIISCLGLFGLVSFNAERRLKEIGIRKILGSSVFGVVRMLTGDFTKTVVIAIFISLPISYLIAKNWLDSFAYRIDLEWWFFAGAGLLVLFIAWVTICLQTLKTARVNPVQCLKDE